MKTTSSLKFIITLLMSFTIAACENGMVTSISIADIKIVTSLSILLVKIARVYHVSLPVVKMIPFSRKADCKIW